MDKEKKISIQIGEPCICYYRNTTKVGYQTISLINEGVWYYMGNGRCARQLYIEKDYNPFDYLNRFDYIVPYRFIDSSAYANPCTLVSDRLKGNMRVEDFAVENIIDNTNGLDKLPWWQKAKQYVLE